MFLKWLCNVLRGCKGGKRLSHSKNKEMQMFLGAFLLFKMQWSFLFLKLQAQLNVLNLKNEVYMLMVKPENIHDPLSYFTQCNLGGKIP